MRRFRWNALFGIVVAVPFGYVAGLASTSGATAPASRSAELQTPQVEVVERGESKARPDDCRAILVGPGVNQPDPFPGYGGFVGWKSPVRLKNGDWLVGFNAGYWHASAPTPLRYPAKMRHAEVLYHRPYIIHEANA